MIVKRKQTPIAVFTYDRPKHTQRALAALTECKRLDECRLHIYCDGPKSQEHEEAVAASRRVVREWRDRLGAQVHATERTENLGVARSVVSGVAELCGDQGRVIVVEDDLVVGPDFLDYMLRALERYRDTPDVYQIAGYMWPIAHPRRPAAFFLPFITAWGWATWDRAWRYFDWEAAGAEEKLADPLTRRRFDLEDDRSRFSTMLRQRLAGQIDTWAILWRYAVFNASGLVLYPRQSFVWNGGFDGSGINSGTSPKLPQPSLGSVRRARLSMDFSLPDNLAVDEEAFHRVKAFMQTRGQWQKPSLIARVRSRILRPIQRPGSG